MTTATAVPTISTFPSLDAWATGALERAAKANEPAEWQEASQFNDRMLYLTAAELLEVAEHIKAMLNAYSDRNVNPALRPTDSRLVSYNYLGFPMLDGQEVSR